MSAPAAAAAFAMRRASARGSRLECRSARGPPSGPPGRRALISPEAARDGSSSRPRAARDAGGQVGEAPGQGGEVRLEESLT